MSEEQHARSARDVLPPTILASSPASIDILAPMREAARTFESDMASSALAAVKSGAGVGGNGSGAQEAVLPRGWERKVDLNGNVFYVDHNTRTTHWDPPTDEELARRLQEQEEQV